MPNIEYLKQFIREIPDFPKKGISFKDITTLLAQPRIFKETVNIMVNHLKGSEIKKVVGIESRGFILGGVLAYHLNAGFVPVRKPGKLPAETISEKYKLEYGTDCLEIHRDAIAKGESVVIVDDLLATGGTMAATVKLVKKLGGNIIEILFLIELEELKGRQKLKNQSVFSLIKYPI